MRDLTFICAYFLNGGMLREQQAVWAAYAPDLKAHFHAIVTDDLSPHSPARKFFEPAGIASQRLYLALEHRRWDWLFGRNLGAHYATTDWILLTDIDHVLPEATLRTILTVKLNPEHVYRFARVDAPHRAPWSPLPCACGKGDPIFAPEGPLIGGCPGLTPYKAHPNTWLLTRAMFDRIGGYDERFSGFYGSDSEFRERVQATAQCVVMRPEPLVRYPREIIPDASTTTYQRKTPEDGLNVPRIKAERAQIEHWRPLRLTIPYRLEASC